MIKKNRNGFTLIELVITIVIVSILSLLAAYAYEVYVEEANHSEVYGMINGIQNAQRVYYSEHGILGFGYKIFNYRNRKRFQKKLYYRG